MIYFLQGDLPWKKNVPVLKQNIESHLEVQEAIQQRDPDTLCCDLDPEFNSILTYLQGFGNPKKRPDYKYIKQ